MSGRLRNFSARSLRRVALPLAAYYVVTLGVPFANGAALSDDFIAHAAVVLIVPLTLIAVGCAVHQTFRLLRECLPRLR